MYISCHSTVRNSICYGLDVHEIVALNSPMGYTPSGCRSQTYDQGYFRANEIDLFGEAEDLNHPNKLQIQKL